MRDAAARRWAAVLIAIFLVALLPRVAAAARFDAPPSLTNDAGWYDAFGQGIAHGDGYVTPDGSATSRWPPGYPAFLGGVYHLTGDSRLAARLAQALLGAATAVLAAELARRLLSAGAGAIAGALIALLPSHLLYSSLLLSEVLFTFLLLAAFVAAARPVSWRAAALGGVLLAAATLVRAQAALLVLAIAASWTAYGALGRERRRATLWAAGAFAVAFVLVLTPWTVRNAVRMHTFAPVSTNLGLNLWMGNNPDAAATVSAAPVAEFDRETAGLSGARREVRFDARARDAALRYVAHHPLEAVSRAPAKIFETYRNDRSFAAWYEPPGASHLAARTRTLIGAVSDGYYYALLLAAAAGMALLAVRRAAAAALPLAVLVVWSLVSVIFFGDTRYHLPILPVLAAPAAYALARLPLLRRAAAALDRQAQTVAVKRVSRI